MRRLYPFSMSAIFLTASFAAAQEPKAPLPNGTKLKLGTDGWLRGQPVGADCKISIGFDYEQGISVREVASGKLLKRIGKDEASGAQFVGATADGTRALTWRFGVLKVWDTSSGQAVAELKPGADGPSSPTWGDQSTSLIAASSDAKTIAFGRLVFPQKKDEKEPEVFATVWDTTRGQCVARVRAAEPYTTAPVLSRDGIRLATWAVMMGPFPGQDPDPNLRADRIVQIWDVATEKEISRVRVAGAKPLAAAFSPNNETLATSCDNGRIQLWTVATGKLKAELVGRATQGRHVAFSPDGTVVFAIAYDLTVERWAADDGRFLEATAPPIPFLWSWASGITALDNKRAVAWGIVGDVSCCWEVPSRKILCPSSNITRAVRTVAFPNDKHVLTLTNDGRLMRWDATSGKLLGTVVLRPAPLPGETSFFSIHTRLSPTGTRAFAGGRVFDPLSGAEEFLVPQTDGVGTTMHSFTSPDLSKVAVITAPYLDTVKPTCRVWDLETRRLVAEFEMPDGVRNSVSAAFSPDNTRLVTIHMNRPAPGQRPVNVITGWDIATGKKLGEVSDSESIGTAHISTVSTTDAVYTGIGPTRAADFVQGKLGPVIENRRPEGMFGAPAVSPDGKRLAIGFREGRTTEFGVRVYDWPRGTLLHTFTGHTGPITALAFSSDGKTLASGSTDTTVLLWDLSPLDKK